MLFQYEIDIAKGDLEDDEQVHALARVRVA